MTVAYRLVSRTAPDHLRPAIDRALCALEGRVAARTAAMEGPPPVREAAAGEIIREEVLQYLMAVRAICAGLTIGDRRTVVSWNAGAPGSVLWRAAGVALGLRVPLRRRAR